MAVLRSEDAAFDLRANARAPLAAWADELQARGFYAARGRGPDAFDCLGIALFVQRLLGRAAPDYLDLYRGLDLGDADAVDALMRAESGVWLDGDGAVGDVLVLGHGGRARHCAVLCGAGYALHARTGAGVRIDPVVGRRAVSRFAGERIYGVVRAS